VKHQQRLWKGRGEEAAADLNGLQSGIPKEFVELKQVRSDGAIHILVVIFNPEI
jgi:hypothetical protein